MSKPDPADSQQPFLPRITDFSFTSAEPLPANYTRELDASGRPYYINHTDNSTSWYHPAASKPQQDPRLPKNIERCVDARGRWYYVNHETKTTSWLNPLKIDEMRACEDGPKLHQRTEDGELDYWVDYEAGTVTVPRKTTIPWPAEERDTRNPGKAGE